MKGGSSSPQPLVAEMYIKELRPLSDIKECMFCSVACLLRCGVGDVCDA